MIQAFVDRYMKNKEQLREVFRKGHPADYMEVVRNVVAVLGEDDDYNTPYPDMITQVGTPDYSGNYLFVVEGDYGKFWCVVVAYGSCSACDTLQSIKYDGSDYDEDGEQLNSVSEKQLDGYMTLALHIVQKLKALHDES